MLIARAFRAEALLSLLPPASGTLSSALAPATTTTAVLPAASPPAAATGDTAAFTRDGSYVGTIHVDIEDVGFVVNYDSCDADLTLTVDTAAVPQISGSTICYPMGILYGQSLVIDIEGTITKDPNVEGFAHLDWSPTFMPNDNWAGRFPDDDTLDGAFSGSASSGSAGFNWTATFTTAR